MPAITALGRERHNIVMFKFILIYILISTRSIETQVQKTKRGNQSQAVFNSLLLGLMKVIHLG